MTENHKNQKKLQYVALGDSKPRFPGIGMMGYYAEMLSQDMEVYNEY
jgi:hypothetical protein